MVVRLAFALIIALIFALFEVTRQFDNHFAGVAIAFDECINHQSHLVQSDMHSGVRNFPVALFVVMFWHPRSKTYVALQRDTVVGKLRQNFTSRRWADVAVMIKACRQNCFVVSRHVTAQLRQNTRQGYYAEAAITLGQARIGDGFGTFLVNAGFLLEPAHQLGFILFLDKLQHDCILLRFVEIKPGIAKMIRFTQDCTGDVAFEFLTLRIFKVELNCTTNTQ